MAKLSDNRAVIYCRVSTEEQASEGVSLDAQWARCRKYCELAGLLPPAVGDRVFREAAVSGSVPLAERPRGAALLHALGPGGIRHVVVAKLDRLWRDTADALATAQLWQERGVALHVVDLGGQAINTATAAGWFCFVQLVLMGDYERRLISERTTAALAHKRANGERVTGRVYGFDVVDGRMVENEAEQSVIRAISRQRKPGPDQATYRAIAARLNFEGLLSKDGGQWHASTVRKVYQRAALGAEADCGDE